MLSLEVMTYSYDRRPVRASKPMSPWFLKMCDKIAQAQKSKIDDRAEGYAESGAEIEELILKNPTASDDEIVKLALPSMEFNWGDILEDRDVAKIIVKWVNHVIHQASTDVAPEDEYQFQIDTVKDDLIVKTRAWGARYGFDPDDEFGTRTEVPAGFDTDPEDAIETQFKRTGAEISCAWKWEHDDQWGDADIVTFPMTIKWHFDEKVLSQKYGAATFEKALKAKLPEFRREAEETQKSRSHAPAPAAPGRKKRK